MSFSYRDIDADVVIIGAGLAGLTTALTLLEKEPSLHILILESSDRIGGRIFSTPVFSNNGKFKNFNLGAQWFNSNQTLLRELLEKCNVQAVKTKPGVVLIDYKEKILKESYLNALNLFSFLEKQQLWNFVDLIDEKCRKLYESNFKLTHDSENLDDFINKTVKSETVRSLISHLVLCNCGVLPEALKLDFYLFFCSSTQGIYHQLISTSDGLREYSFTINGQGICKSIAEKIGQNHIILEEEVIRISMAPQEIKIDTKSSSYYCFYAVIAVPPHCIKKIKFHPVLNPEKRKVLEESVDGKLIKFTATYEKAFWTDLGFSGEIFILDKPTKNRPLVFCYDSADPPALGGFFYPSNPSSNHKTSILNQLKDYFGDEVLNSLHYAEKSFRGSPTTCLGSAQDVKILQERFERIFWAGAETSLAWFGTMAGAAFSGKLAAVQVLYELRPASLTKEDMGVIMPLRRRCDNKLKTCADEISNRINWTVTLVSTGIGSCLLLLIIYKLWRKGYFEKFAAIFMKTKGKT